INDIIITEYVEGSASNKAVEISNIGTSNYTFDGTLSLYYSSYKNVIKNSKGQNVLEGITLAPGKSIVVVNGDSSTELRQYVERLGGKDALVVAGTYDQVQHSAMNFNGDDAVWLGVGSDASGVKNIFGNYGHSGDKIWADQTMRRKSGSKPATTYQEAEWEKLSINAFGGLGHPTDVNDEPLPPPPANLPC
ncbi:nuclease, partial [Vibrio vulnificus]